MTSRQGNKGQEVKEKRWLKDKKIRAQREKIDKNARAQREKRTDWKVYKGQRGKMICRKGNKGQEEKRWQI